MTKAPSYSMLFATLLLSAVSSFSSTAYSLEPKKADTALAKPEAPAKAEAPAKPTEAKPAAQAAAAPDGKPQMTEIQKFCSNNATSAGDARAAWQAAKLVDLEQQIKQRIAELDAKRAEYEQWLKKRDEALKKAEDGVVAIYSKMRPDAAALQLAAMDDVMAATLLAKLPIRNASLILNEIEPGRAARLANTMTSIGAAPDGKKS